MAFAREVVAVAVVTVLVTMPLAADGQETVPLSANVTLTSDYVFRGYTQTSEDLAVQGGLDWEGESGWSIGVWGSNLDFGPGDDASLELDIYGGYSWQVNNTSYGAGLIYYAYPGAGSESDYGFIEAYASLGHDFEAASLSAALHFTPDNFGGTGNGWYVTGGLARALSDAWSVDANVGFSQVTPEFGEDYLDWNLGLSYSFSALALDLRYHDTDAPACTDACDSRIVLSVSAGF
ncbi:TorF family putative porin [Candidatus Foliamicus sp.]